MGSKQRLRICKLGLGDTTSEGSYYPMIDGKAWGEAGRAFWPTEAEARQVGMRALTKLIAFETTEAQSAT